MRRITTASLFLALALGAAGCGNTSSTTAASAITATGLPGATSFATVEPLLVNDCVPCHATFGTQAGFAPFQATAASLVGSRAMPRPGSPQAAMSDADRQTLVNYCNGD